MQNGLVERNAGVPPEKRIEFRVGVHVGEVVEESDCDLMGDAVNVAARLEGIAKPGAICLSDPTRTVKAPRRLQALDVERGGECVFKVYCAVCMFLLLDSWLKVQLKVRGSPIARAMFFRLKKSGERGYVQSSRTARRAPRPPEG